MSSDSSCIHGINKMKKPATKVTAPPGGRSNINIFGGVTAAPVAHVNENQRKRNDSSLFKAPVGNNNATNMNNNLECSEGPPENVRPSTKVMAPPGGKTSINLFG